MTRSLLVLALIAAACRADETDPDKPASPPLPAPEGLTIVKHKDGLRSPEGFEVRQVTEVGTGARAVAFADDGSFYLLELGKGVNTIVPFKGEKPVAGKPVLTGRINGSIAVFDGWLYAHTDKGLLRIQGEKSERVVTAMGGSGPRLAGPGIVGFGIGPDGWLYVGTEEGDVTLIGSDESQASVTRTGAIFRCTPDGKRVHLFALGLHCPAGSPAFDSAGNLFHIDADMPDAGRFTGCRLLHVADQGDYGYRTDPGTDAHKPDPHRAAAFGERPGTIAPLLKTGRGMPSGLFAYHDTRLPEAYRGRLLYPDPYDRTVRAYRVKPHGATFRAVEEFVLLAGGDSFRPCCVTTGPDGALYVLERDGRLWRLTWKGTKDEEELKPRDRDSWAKVAKLDEADAVKALADPDATIRERARLALVRLGDKGRPGLIKVLRDDEQGSAARINALVGLRPAYAADAKVREAFMDALASGDMELRRLIIETMGLLAKRGDAAAHDIFLRRLGAIEPPLKRAAALAMGRVAGPAAADNLASALSFDDGKCPVLRDGLLRALESLEKPGIDALLALMDSGSQKDIDRVAEAFLGLRSKAAFAALPGLTRNPHLDAMQRSALVRSSVRHPGASLDALADQIANNPKEENAVKSALLDALATPGVVFGKRPADWALKVLADGPEELRPRATAALRARLKAAGVSADERRAIEKALAGK